ncbi:MAG: magnesium ion transporter [Sarcosagium campestre]|nr:MAG: magnesium ion transporter [Sarcosagium campestre]
MHRASRLNASAPSSNLLKFLKAQSESRSFPSPKPRNGIWTADRVPRRVQCQRQHFPYRTWPLPSSRVRTLSTSSHRAASIRPGSPNAKVDIPRLSHMTNMTPTGSQCQTRSSAPLSMPWINLQRSGIRQASTGHRPWLKRIMDLGRGKTSGRSKPEDYPAGFLGDATETPPVSFGRSVSGKASNELKLRCTEFDECGNVTLVNGEFKKSELIAKYGLLPRDLRKIDSSLLPHILVRPSAILINLLHLRVLIKHNRVLVFDVYGSTDSYTQSVFMYDLEGKLRQREARQAGGLPYEFRALEAVLISVMTALEAEFEGVREPVVRVLRELEEDIDRDKLRHLLIFSKKLGTFEQKATLVRDSIDELLEADDDLAAMYLTEKAEGGGRGETDHTEVEMLLESYHKLCDEIVQESGNLVSSIRNTEEIVKAILDANRNSLMLLDLKFSIGTLGIGSGAFIAALYGMNLKNFLEDSDFGFLGVSAWSFLFAAAVCGYGLVKLRKVQRVSMWGERGSVGNRGSWRDVDALDNNHHHRDRVRLLRESRAAQTTSNTTATHATAAAAAAGSDASIAQAQAQAQINMGVDARWTTGAPSPSEKDSPKR